jgi:hypothetical protein
MPVDVLAAGGTRQMGRLSGKGRALREVLGERVVLALADNDSEGAAIQPSPASSRPLRLDLGRNARPHARQLVVEGDHHGRCRKSSRADRLRSPQPFLSASFQRSATD